MSVINVGSPFKAGGTAQTLPITGREGKVVIRCDDDDTANRILINIGADAAAGKAMFYLGPGEAIEIGCTRIPLGATVGISILNVGNDPDIYWGLV